MRILKPLPGTLQMPGHPLADAVCLWPMNSLGNKVFDVSVNGNTGTLQGNTFWSFDGKYDHALSFSGGDEMELRDYVKANRKPYSNSEPFSVIIIARASALINYQTLISTLHINPYPNWAVYTQADGSWGTYLGVHRRSAAGLVTVGQLNHYAVTYNGSVLTIYRNAIQERQDLAISFTADNTPQVVTIGRFRSDETLHAASHHWNGLIIFASIYSRALFASEVAQHCREAFCMFPESRVFAA